MCFNSPISFSTFLIEVFISLYLYKRNEKYDQMNAIFIFTFALIQLWEGGIWENPQSSFVSAILLSLWLQPIAQTYGAYEKTKNTYLLIFVYFYFATFLYAITRVVNGKFSVSKGKHCHLIWEDSSSPASFVGGKFLTFVYLVGLFVPLMITKQYILLGIGIFTLLFSLYNYRNSGEFSSYWCFSALFYAIAAIFTN